LYTLTADTNEYYFVWDRPLAENNYNLMDSRFAGRFAPGSNSLIPFCKQTGDCKDASLTEAKKLKKFIYQIGTLGSPANWFGGYRTGQRVNLFDVIQLSRPIVMKALQERRAILHIDQGWEGFPLMQNKTILDVDVIPSDYDSLLYTRYVNEPKNFYDVFYHNCEAYNILPSQIIITTSNLLEKQIHDKYYSDKQHKLNIVSSIPFCGLLKFHNQEDSISFEEQIKYKSDTTEMKSFSCLNRVTRQHRIALCVMLNYYNLLDPKISDISHSAHLGGHPGLSKEPIKPEHAIPYDWDSHPAFTSDNIDSFIKKLPCVLDQSDFNQNHVWTMFKETYLRTWFSLIPETAFNEERETACFLSEKIFKPMLCHQPFVLAGHPNSLAQLKQLGFKTFDTWWDESYDTIVTPTARMDAICKLTQELKNKSNAEWLEMYKDMQEVLEHNYKHLDEMGLIDYSESLNV